MGTSQTATTTYTYGDATHPGDPTQVTDPDLKLWQFTFDSYGNLASKTDPLNNKTTYFYDTIGRMTSEVTPDGNVSGGKASQYCLVQP